MPRQPLRLGEVALLAVLTLAALVGVILACLGVSYALTRTV